MLKNVDAFFVVNLCLLDGRVSVKYLLFFTWINVLSPTYNHILNPANYFTVTILVNYFYVPNFSKKK